MGRLEPVADSVYVSVPDGVPVAVLVPVCVGADVRDAVMLTEGVAVGRCDDVVDALTPGLTLPVGVAVLLAVSLADGVLVTVAVAERVAVAVSDAEAVCDDVALLEAV